MSLKKCYAFIILFFVMSMSQASSDINFEVKVHDFGIVREGDKATFSFEFENLGEDSLKLESVKASCGCTVPNWPKNAFGKSEKGEINVTYNSTGRIGGFYKTITIKTAEFETAKVVIKGVVISKSKYLKDLKTATRTVPAIKLDKKEINVGKVEVNKALNETITLTNVSTDTITFLKVEAGCRCVNSLVRNKVIAPGKSLDVEFRYTPRYMTESSDILVFQTSDMINPGYEVKMNTLLVESFAPKSSEMLQDNDGPQGGVFGF